jgi:hypothetical protein
MMSARNSFVSLFSGFFIAALPAAAQVHPTAHTWYDELIISRTKISDPDSAADAIPLAQRIKNRVSSREMPEGMKAG